MVVACFFTFEGIKFEKCKRQAIIDYSQKWKLGMVVSARIDFKMQNHFFNQDPNNIWTHVRGCWTWMGGIKIEIVRFNKWVVDSLTILTVELIFDFLIGCSNTKGYVPFWWFISFKDLMKDTSFHFKLAYFILRFLIYKVASFLPFKIREIEGTRILVFRMFKHFVNLNKQIKAEIRWKCCN